MVGEEGDDYIRTIREEIIWQQHTELQPGKFIHYYDNRISINMIMEFGPKAETIEPKYDGIDRTIVVIKTTEIYGLSTYSVNDKSAWYTVYIYDRDEEFENKFDTP